MDFWEFNDVNRIFENLTYLNEDSKLLEKLLFDKSNFWFLFKKFRDT